MKKIADRWKDVIESISKSKKQQCKKQLKKMASKSVERVRSVPQTYFRRGRYFFDPKKPWFYVTRREKTTLDYLAEGKTFRATAQAMDIAYRTVEYFVVRIRKRFGCAKAKELLVHPVIARYLKKENIARSTNSTSQKMENNHEQET